MRFLLPLLCIAALLGSCAPNFNAEWRQIDAEMDVLHEDAVLTNKRGEKGEISQAQVKAEKSAQRERLSALNRRALDVTVRLPLQHPLSQRGVTKVVTPSAGATHHHPAVPISSNSSKRCVGRTLIRASARPFGLRFAQSISLRSFSV